MSEIYGMVEVWKLYQVGRNLGLHPEPLQVKVS